MAIRAIAHAGTVSLVRTGPGVTTCLSTTGLAATVRPVTGSSSLSTIGTSCTLASFTGTSATTPALKGLPQFGHATELPDTSLPHSGQ